MARNRKKLRTLTAGTPEYLVEHALHCFSRGRRPSFPSMEYCSVEDERNPKKNLGRAVKVLYLNAFGKDDEGMEIRPTWDEYLAMLGFRPQHFNFIWRFPV